MTAQRLPLQFRDQFERPAAFFRDRPTLEGALIALIALRALDAARTIA
jgi:hypothetical protein